jgi:ribosomal protein S18 acetylase RimI-like enzyme
MLFCDIELARRIESAECRLVCEIGQVLVAGGRDAFVVPMAGGAGVFGGPDSPFNKLVGLGFDGTPEPSALDQVEKAFSARGVTVRAEVSSLADPALLAALSARGYSLVGFEDVLGRTLDDLPPGGSTGAVHVRELPASDVRTYIDVVVTGFLAPDSQGVPGNESFPRDTLESLFLDVFEAPGYHHFLAMLDGAAAGGAAVRVDRGLAQLAGAATLPDWRRRGVQSALLDERLRWAAARGCDLAVVTTLPGSKSQQNVLRRGFERLYTRAVMVKQP